MRCNIAQHFGQNANPLYKGWGLKGHTGLDETCGYGSEIASEKRMKVYKVFTVEKPAQDGFTAIFGIDDDGNEWLYGHGDPLVQEGQSIEKGEIIGTEANHGRVYQWGVEITLKMQEQGDKRGSHRHVQKRICKRVTWRNPNKYHLTYGNGFFFDGRYYYEIPDYNNGYNGCVDWYKEELIKLRGRLIAEAIILLNKLKKYGK